MCVRCYESVNGGVYDDQRQGDSPPRYYYIRRDVLEAMYKKDSSGSIHNIFLARKTPEDQSEGTVIDPNPNIHPLTRERTIVIFHCLVTKSLPSLGDYVFLPGEKTGPGNDLYFQDFYSKQLKSPRGNLKRWEYRYNNKQDTLMPQKSSNNILKENGFGSKDRPWVIDTNNLKQPGSIYYISPQTQKACACDKNSPYRDGGDFVARNKDYLTTLGIQAKAFYADEAFYRLESQMICNYSAFDKHRDTNHTLETVRCYRHEATAFYMCHPMFVFRRSPIEDKVEPVRYHDALEQHKDFLEYVHDLCLCKNPNCVSNKKHGNWKGPKLTHYKEYSVAASLLPNQSMSCFDYMKGIASKYSGGLESDQIKLPMFAYGGILIWNCTNDLVDPDVDEKTESNRFRFKEGNKISKFLQFMVHCHDPPDGKQKMSVEDFQEKLFLLREDVKKKMSEVQLVNYSLPIDYHSHHIQFVISKKGEVTGDQDVHGDEHHPYKIGFAPCQDMTKPTVALRRNDKFITEGNSLKNLGKLLDKMVYNIESMDYDFPPLSEVFSYLKDDYEDFSQFKWYIQVFLFPCFQRPEAIYNYKKKQEISEHALLTQVRPCCSCKSKNKCIQKNSCECKAQGKYCTNCAAKCCRNTEEGKKLQKSQRRPAKKHGEETERNQEDQGETNQEEKAQEPPQDNEVEDTAEAESQPERVRQLQSQYSESGGSHLQCGDLMILPGAGEKGLLHYGVMRQDQVQIAFTCCPKDPHVPHYSGFSSGRSHTQFLAIMEKCWHIFPHQKKFELRLDLLQWFSFYLCLSLCNGRKVSDELAVFINLHPRIVEIENRLLNPSKDTTGKDKSSEDNTPMSLPINGKLCFEPNYIPSHDYSSGEVEPEQRFSLTEEFEGACMWVSKYFAKQEMSPEQ